MGLFDNNNLGFSSSNPFLNKTPSPAPVSKYSAGFSGSGNQGVGQYNPDGSFIPASQLSGGSGGGGGGGNGSGGSSGGKSDKQKAEDKQKALEDKVRSGIKGQYGALSANLNELMGWLPNQENDLKGQVDSMGNSNINSINNAKNAELAKFGGYRQEVADNQKNTLADLASNTRNMFQAGNTFLGSRGAGNSSATGMYSAALTQQANQQRGDVAKQASGLYNDLNQKEVDVNTAAQSQIDAVETWKSGRLSEIMAQFQDLSRQLKMQMGQADATKKAALAQLDKDLLNNAINQVNTIQQNAATYKSNIAANISSQIQSMQQAGTQAVGGAAAGAGQIAGTGMTTDTSGMEMKATNIQSTQDGYVGDYQGKKVRVDEAGNVIGNL